MPQITVALVIALADFGAASGIEVMARRRGSAISGAGEVVASMAGVAYFALIGMTVFVSQLQTSIPTIALGMFGTAMLVKLLPGTLIWVVSTALVGIVGTALYLFA